MILSYLALLTPAFEEKGLKIVQFFKILQKQGLNWRAILISAPVKPSLKHLIPDRHQGARNTLKSHRKASLDFSSSVKAVKADPRREHNTLFLAFADITA